MFLKKLDIQPYEKVLWVLVNNGTEQLRALNGMQSRHGGFIWRLLMILTYALVLAKLHSCIYSVHNV